MKRRFSLQSIGDPLARAMYRVVMGQVRSYLKDHPDHVAPYAKRTIELSLAKRIVHDLMSRETTRVLMKRAEERKALRSKDR